MSVEIYGTLGPSCADAATLVRMIGAGMTGIRLNLSHTTLREAKPYLDAVRAAERGGVLRSRKSAALPGVEISLPAMTAQDRENLALAPSCGVTAVM